MDSTRWYAVLIAAVALERLAELVVSNRHAQWAFKRGGVESGRGHFPAMVALHTGFLVACLVEVVSVPRSFVPTLGWPMLALALASQTLRWWCIKTLGTQWNTRVIVVPGMSRVTGGPYRFLNHPNYLAVVVEGIALPLVHSAWWTALGFTLLNALVLRSRLRAENAALAQLVP